MIENNNQNRKIKVMEIITALPIGGAERLLFDICQKIDKNKFDVSVVAVIRGGDLFYQFRSAGINVKIIGKESKLGLKTAYKIYREIKSKKPDVVHTHLFAADWWGGIAAWLAGAPKIITTRHNLMLDEGSIKAKISVFAYRHFFTKIIAISQAVKKDILVHNPKLESKVEQVYNGVDPAKFTINNYEWRDPPVIGIIGRLTLQKGHLYFFEALKLIKDLPWWAKVIGDGESRSNLVRLVQDLGLSSKIQFVGNAPNMVQELNDLDIICAPSVWEGLNLSVIEGMFARKPIVAFRTDGLVEAVEDGRTGWLVERLNVKELAEALKILLKDQSLAKKMGEAGQKRAQEIFPLDKMIARYEKNYLE